MKIKIPKFLKKKRNIIIIIVVLAVILLGFFFFRNKNDSSNIQTGFVKKQNLQETVLSTGQVVSKTDLGLSFQTGGVIRQVLVKEGDQVSRGQLLASLDQSAAMASLTTAKGSLAQAQANYNKLVAGANPQTIKASQASVDLAKQDLANAYKSALSTLNTGYISVYNAYNVVISLKDSYFITADPEGIVVQNSKNDMEISMKNIKRYLDTAQKASSYQDIDIAISQEIIALTNSYNDITAIRDQCDSGVYYYNVTSTFKTSLDTHKANINTALASVTSLQQNIASLKLALQKAEDQLGVTTAPPTQAEIDLAKAQIISAQGQVDAAQATLNYSIITAPESGTITQVDIRVGEQATAMKEAIVLQDVGNLHAEANVSEASIASLQIGQSIDYTFDALGPDQHFQGKILTINPASTVISGVVNYKVTGSLENIPSIKPGMTANMTILVAEKENVLSVPSTAVINKNGGQYIRVVDDVNKKTYHEIQVTTGIQADGGLIEIISGIDDGQQIVTYIKQ